MRYHAAAVDQGEAFENKRLINTQFHLTQVHEVRYAVSAWQIFSEAGLQMMGVLR